MARICNNKWVRFGVISGYEQKILSLSDRASPGTPIYILNFLS